MPSPAKVVTLAAIIFESRRFCAHVNEILGLLGRVRDWCKADEWLEFGRVLDLRNGGGRDCLTEVRGGLGVCYPDNLSRRVE
ncbi:hypothetical protein ACHAPF_010998 [Botrytis cinerea]